MNYSDNLKLNLFYEAIDASLSDNNLLTESPDSEEFESSVADSFNLYFHDNELPYVAVKRTQMSLPDVEILDKHTGKSITFVEVKMKTTDQLLSPRFGLNNNKWTPNTSTPVTTIIQKAVQRCPMAKSWVNGLTAFLISNDQPVPPFLQSKITIRKTDTCVSPTLMALYLNSRGNNLISDFPTLSNADITDIFCTHYEVGKDAHAAYIHMGNNLYQFNRGNNPKDNPLNFKNLDTIQGNTNTFSKQFRISIRGPKYQTAGNKKTPYISARGYEIFPTFKLTHIPQAKYSITNKEDWPETF